MNSNRLKGLSLLTLTLSSFILIPSTFTSAEEDSKSNDKLILNRYNSNRTVLLTVKEKIKDYENNVVLHQLGIKDFDLLVHGSSVPSDKPLNKFTTISNALEEVGNTEDIKGDVDIKYFYDSKNKKVSQTVETKYNGKDKYTILVYSSNGKLESVYFIK